MMTLQLSLNISPVTAARRAADRAVR